MRCAGCSGMLRQGSAEPQLSPQPGLGDLAALVEQVRAAGLPVELELVGEPLQLGTWRRPHRLQDRAGGAHECDQARRADDRAAAGLLCARGGRGRGGRPGARRPRERWRPRPRRNARARGALPRHARSRAAPERRLSRPRTTAGWAGVTTRRHLRRPGARPRRIQDDPRSTERPRRGRRGRRRQRGRRARALTPARRHADGHPHAEPRRDRGDEAGRHGVATHPRDDADHLRRGRLRLAGDESRRERVPAQGRAARGSCSGSAHGRARRRAARARDHAPARSRTSSAAPNPARCRRSSTT